MCAPYRPQANGRAEQFSRLMIEGTRCFLHQAGLGERWWPSAIKLWCMNYNVLYPSPDGLAPWQRRFGAGHEFKAYPFGAGVLHTHPKQSRFPGAIGTGDKRITKKLRNRLIPGIFHGVTIAPGCRWAWAYQVVPLASLLSENRASRVSFRTLADVAFPEGVLFPFQRRLTLNCAFEDSTLPALHDTNEKELWAVIVDSGFDDEGLVQFEGICNENSPQFQTIKTVEIMMAIDPDTSPHEAESSEN